MDKSITDPNYKERPEKSINLIERLAKRWKDMKLVMPAEQRAIYEAIGHKCAGKMVADLGCGLGIGTNILSRQSKFAWGVDISEEHIQFAKQMFTGNNIDFYCMDAKNPKREIAKFDVIVMVELIEHIDDWQSLLDSAKKLAKPSTLFYVTSPNRNSPLIAKDTPRNEYHVREWSAAEFYKIMTDNFASVMLYDYELRNDLELDTLITPIVIEAKGAL